MSDEKRGLLPSYAISDVENSSPRIVDVTSEDADLVFDALSSSTARRIYGAVSDDPATPSDLAEQLNLSLQNVHYHLRNLQDANLIKEVGTGYSEKGVEISIYGPADDPIVLSNGDESDHSRLKELLSQGSGAVIILGILSLFVQWAVKQGLPKVGDQPAPTPTPGPLQPGEAATAIPPGVIFFVGGLMMLVFVLGYQYYRTS